MGHKVHPVGFRLGITVPGHDQPVRDWQAKWFAGKGIEYAAQVIEDAKIRRVIDRQYGDAGIARVEIERNSQDLIVNVHTARPGIVIGRGGQRVEELRKSLEEVAGTKRVRLNVLEIRQPELDAFLVARNIADQLERRVAYRRAVRQTVQRTMQAGAKGVKVNVAGRLGGSEIARRDKAMEGRVPLHTLRADIDYGLAEAATSMGRIGVKVWIYRGEMVPKQRIVALEEETMAPVEVTVTAAEAVAPVEARVEVDVVNESESDASAQTN
jgi:small subunit ribosomal protein S3